MPYQVGLFRFAPDCGLYFICGFTEDGQDEDLEYLLDWLGATGIGGKVSSPSSWCAAADLWPPIVWKLH